jgi:hypothetical protein
LVPQLPQLAGSVEVAVQVPLQLFSPLGQAMPQVPALQAWPLVHFWPQLPQLLASVKVLTQPPGQLLSPVGQPAPHAPKPQV